MIVEKHVIAINAIAVLKDDKNLFCWKSNLFTKQHIGTWTYESHLWLELPLLSEVLDLLKAF